MSLSPSKMHLLIIVANIWRISVTATSVSAGVAEEQVSLDASRNLFSGMY
jgi:hypothetical protein